MVTINSAENALKTVYLGAVTELLNTKVNPLLAKIEQTASDVWGKEIRKAAKYGVNGGIGAGDEDGTLPAASPTTYVQFVSTLKNLYGQIEISDKAIRASADGRGSFTDLLNSELEDLLTASRFNLGRMLYGDGTGKLCKITDASNKKVDSTRNLAAGLVVDVYNASGALVAGGIKVLDVNYSVGSIELSSWNNVVANCTLYVQGSKDKEITGIGSLFSSSDTLYGLKRSDYSFLNSVSEASESIDEIVMQKLIDKLEMVSGSNIDYIACSAQAKYAYQEYMASFKRNIDIMELNGGYKTLTFNGIPLVYDRFVPEGEMIFLDTSAIKMHQLCDWRYLETENGKILRQTQGKPTYTATLVKYCDLICDRPNGQGRITGIV
ncbi:MAG: phage major capsid protein [Clostridiales bacterium]|nr:phage major capsid protein [Clostridiales bacterium]